MFIVLNNINNNKFIYIILIIIKTETNINKKNYYKHPKFHNLASHCISTSDYFNFLNQKEF